MSKTTWYEDTGAEAVMDGLKIAFEVEDISRIKVDRKKSSENRAREKPIDSDRVASIKVAVKNGVPLPMIVVRRFGSGLVIAGGNHRFNATEDATFPAYIVACADAEFETLCRALNTVVGQGSTASERVSHAVDAVERLGLRVGDAAKTYQVTAGAIKNRIAVIKAKRRIESLPLSVRNKFTQTHSMTIGHKLRSNSNILRAAANMVAATGVGAKSEEYRDACIQAEKAKTEAEAVQVFESLTTITATNNPIIPRKKHRKFVSAVTQLGSLESAKTFEDLEFAKAEIPEITKRCKKLARFLNSLCKASG